MTEKIYVAADFGAGSGRVIAGRFDGSRLRFEETNRFENAQTPLPGGLHWDMVALYRHLLEGIRRAKALGAEPVSVGVDTWGVDCALVDAAGRLCGLPHSYRDPRLDGVMDETCAKLGRRRPAGGDAAALLGGFRNVARGAARPRAIRVGGLPGLRRAVRRPRNPPSFQVTQTTGENEP